jgi:hypothetical protein
MDHRPHALRQARDHTTEVFSFSETQAPSPWGACTQLLAPGFQRIHFQDTLFQAASRQGMSTLNIMVWAHMLLFGF